MSEDRHRSTGVHGLDTILGGGLLSHALHLVEGAAGTGKTILANQICFHRARSGERAVYVTTVAQAHGRMLEHLRSLRFFDESQVSRSIVYLSAVRPLLQHGAAGLLQVVAAALREHQPTTVVIDGFQFVRELVSPSSALAELVLELSTLLAAAKCTTLLCATPDPNANQLEYALVDGLIELGWCRSARHHVRELEVHKLRGTAYLRGRHAFRITDLGVSTFPRLEAIVAREAPAAKDEAARRAFGVPHLDDMLRGGVLEGSTTLLVGPPGTGKTLLGLKFLEAGARRGEPGLYFGFYETPDRLLAQAARVGIDLRTACADGALEIVWFPAIEQILDELAERLLGAVQRRSVARLVIDGVDGLRDAAADPNRIMSFLIALTTKLRALGVTTLLSEEERLVGASAGPPLTDLTTVTENVVVLRYVPLRSQTYRMISILKSRESDHDASTRLLAVTGHGVEIGASSEDAESILADAAGRPRGSGSARKRA